MTPTDEQPARLAAVRSVFISYRRADTQGWAGHVGDSLTRTFGKTPIFLDVLSITPGENFRTAITRAIGVGSVGIALIGPRWLSATLPDGRRRLDDPDDLVRAELETALGLGILVIPVLVGGASMPEPDSLPHPLRALSQRTALELTDARWNYDFERLATVIEGAGLKRPDNPTGSPEAPASTEVHVGTNSRLDDVEAGDVTGIKSTAPLGGATTLPNVDVLGGATIVKSKLGNITGLSVGPDSTD